MSKLVKKVTIPRRPRDNPPENPFEPKLPKKDEPIEESPKSILKVPDNEDKKQVSFEPPEEDETIFELDEEDIENIIKEDKARKKQVKSERLRAILDEQIDTKKKQYIENKKKKQPEEIPKPKEEDEDYMGLLGGIVATFGLTAFMK